MYTYQYKKACIHKNTDLSASNASSISKIC